jgi:hypothetical protein
MKPFLLCFSAVVLLLAGCGSPNTAPVDNHGRTGHFEPGALSRISVGMTKEQVIPMFYTEERPWWQWRTVRIKLVDNHVTEFGTTDQTK